MTRAIQIINAADLMHTRLQSVSAVVEQKYKLQEIIITTGAVKVYLLQLYFSVL